MQPGIDVPFEIEEDQRRDVGEGEHRENVGPQQLGDLLVEPPPDDDVERQHHPQQRHGNDEHAPLARHVDPRPGDDVHVGDGDQQEPAVAKEEPSLVFIDRHADEEIRHEDQAYEELNPQVGG